jgi:3-dehydroquinate dehydratase
MRAQDVVLKAELSRDSIMIGEQAQWSLKATLDKSLASAFPLIDSLADKRVEILEMRADTLQQSSSNITLQATWFITSFDAGIYHLPQLPFLVRRANGQIDTLYSEALTLKVKTVAIDTTDFQPFDIKLPIEYPITLGEILPYIGFGLLILAILALAIYMFIRWKQNKPLFFAPRPKDPPYVTALRELEKIKAEKLWQNNKVKLYYTKVTDVLRIYLNAQFQIQAMEQTSEEILQSLQSMELPDELRNRLREMLGVSNLVKFAKYQPEQHENEGALTVVSDFVYHTKPTEEGEKNEQ